MVRAKARPGATQEEVRRRNLSTVLRAVHEAGAVSRAELTSSMGLNRSTIKALVAELEGAGLVREEIPDTRLGAGRPSHVVIPCHESVYVLAANINVDAVQVAVVSLGGRVIARKEYRLAGVGSDPDVVAARLARELRALAGRAPHGARLVGVGVGVAGVVRNVDGFIEFAPNLQWHRIPWGEILTARLRLPVVLRVANDGDLGALAELVRGAGRGLRDLVYVAGEVGIGGGLVMAGQLIQGAGGYAGEIGHILVNPDGRACRCGNRGCWETEAGEEALLRAGGMPPEAGRRGARRLLARARLGDPEAVGAVHEVALWVGRGIGSLVNVLNPDMVILGGVLSSVFELAEDTVRQVVERQSLDGPHRDLRLAAAGLGGDSSLIGAAELAFELLLSDPAEGWVTSAGA